MGITVVAFLGPDSVGKTTLLQKLGSYVQRRDGLAAPPVRTVFAVGASVTVLDVRTANGFSQYVDFPHTETEPMLLGASPVQGAVLVVSLADSVMPGTRQSLKNARQAGIPRVAVAFTKCDQVEDPEMCDLVTMEVRDLLNTFEYQGDSAPVLLTAALGTPLVEGEGPMIALGEFLTAVQRWIP